MSDISASVGVDLDASNGGLVGDLLAKLHIGINDAVTELKRANRIEQARLADLPNYFTVSKAPDNPAAVTGTLNFGGPQPGRQWRVRLLAGISNDLSTNATKAAWYVGSNVLTAPGILPATQLRWLSTALPDVQKFNGEIIVNPNEQLILGLTAIPASSSLTFTACIEDMIQDDARFMVAVS